MKLAECDFVAARRRLEAKAKSAGEKLTTVEDAVARVQDGDHVAVGGCLFSRTPMALVREILRQRRTGLTLSRNLMCTEGEFLMVAGGVERVVTAWMSIGLPWGVSQILRHYVESGQGRPGGVEPPRSRPALPRGGHGRAVPARADHAGLGPHGRGRNEDHRRSLHGETLAAVPALFPDVALIHVHRADRFGNAQIDGYPHMDADIARAATTVLMTTEEIVPEEETRRYPERTAIPGFAVDALVLAPFGSFPHECYALYEADYEHFGEYTAAIEARGPAAVVEYLDRYAFGPPTFNDYLDLFGGARLAAQQKKARELTR